MAQPPHAARPLLSEAARPSAAHYRILLMSWAGWVFDFYDLILYRVVTGLGVGGEWATGQTYVAEAFPPRMRGRYGAFMQTGAPVGIALATLVGGFVAPRIGWRETFWLSFLPALLVIHIRRSLPESNIWQERRRLPGRREERAGSWRLLLVPPHRRVFLLCLVLAIFDMSAYWFTYSWLPGYLHQQRGLSLAKSALWMLVTQTGGFLGYASFGLVADRLGRRPAHSLFSCLMALMGTPF